MKKLITIFTAILINLTVISQTNLNVLYSEGDNVTHISSESNNIYYSTSNGVFENDININTNSLVNDINGSNYAYGDTSIIGNSFCTGTEININNTPYSNNININDLTSDGNILYVIDSYGTDEYAIKEYNISNGALTTNTNFTAYGLDGHSDIEYFTLNSTNYISIIYDYFGTMYLGFYNLNTDEFRVADAFFNTAETITTHNGNLYYSVGDEIYEVTSIVNSASPDNVNITSTLVYTINDGSLINEFTFNNNGDIYTATDNGVYTTDVIISLSINEDMSFNNTTLYPNPNNGTFTIDNLEYETTVNILNMSGQLIHSEVVDYSTTINIDSYLPTGMYIVQLSNSTSQKTIKFTKR